MPTYMIRTTLDRMRQRLQDIQGEKYDVAKELQVAASHGDLSENAEYDAAKEHKEMLAIEEMRLREWLSDVAIIEEMDLPDNMVTLGKRVKVRDLESGEEMEFAILGEHDKLDGIEVVSASAPLGRGLLNKKQGRSAEIQLPRGTRRYKILEVSNVFE